MRSQIEEILPSDSDHGFYGAVIVSKDGKTLFSQGYGWANEKKQTPNSTSIVFDIGSNTKQFTAACILKLVELEKLKLSDKLENYIPEISADKANITIHQLMSHTSGLVESLGRDAEYINKSELVQRINSHPLDFQPGSQFQYSNVGYSVLAAVIEAITQQPYEQFLYAALLEPLGLKHTGYLLPEWNRSADSLALGYRHSIFETPSTIQLYQNKGVTWHLVGNGGINSTLQDLHTWLQALFACEVLNPENTQKLFAAQYQPQDSTKWHGGYGWFTNQTSFAGQMISHSGSNGYFQSSICWFPDEKLLVLTYTNAQSHETERLAGSISKQLLSEDAEIHAFQPSHYYLSREFIQSHQPHSASELPQFLKTRSSTEYDLKRLINRMGSYELHKQSYLWANALYRLNVELHPNDGNLWDSLGEGYFHSGDLEEAIKCFEKAIQLGEDGNCHWCDNSQSRLQNLKNQRSVNRNYITE